MALLPVIGLILAILYLEFFVELSHFHEGVLLVMEDAVLVYFVIEIVIDLIIYEDHRKFLRDRWIDILLVLPFLRMVRVLRFAGRFTRALGHVIRGTGRSKILKSPLNYVVLQGTKLLETLQSKSLMEGLKVLQKIGKSAKKMGERLGPWDSSENDASQENQ